MLPESIPKGNLLAFCPCEPCREPRREPSANRARTVANRVKPDSRARRAFSRFVRKHSEACRELGTHTQDLGSHDDCRNGRLDVRQDIPPDKFDTAYVELRTAYGHETPAIFHRNKLCPIKTEALEGQKKRNSSVPPSPHLQC